MTSPGFFVPLARCLLGGAKLFFQSVKKDVAKVQGWMMFRCRETNNITPHHTMNKISLSTLSFEVSQLTEKRKLREAFSLLPEAHAVPPAIDRLQRCFKAIEDHYSELHDLFREVREELSEDWSEQEVRSFLAGAWQGMSKAVDHQAQKALEAIYI